MLVIGLALGSATALAGPDRFGSGRGLPPEFAAFDKDGNGVLSEEEKAALKAAIEAQREAFLAKYDTNKDGVLSPEELAVAKADREAAELAEKTATFAKIDTSGDGKLSEAELAAWMPVASADRVKATLTRMDTDKDGFVSLAEFTAKPQGPRRPPGGQRQPPRPPRGGRP
jgi:Ca2+-binding EF-hand superfamily protein